MRNLMWVGVLLVALGVLGLVIPNVKFTDGTPFDAAAVKANFDRITDPANKLKRYNLFSVIAKTVVIDPTTVKVTLKYPFSAFINTLAHPSAVSLDDRAIMR